MKKEVLPMLEVLEVLELLELARYHPAFIILRKSTIPIQLVPAKETADDLHIM